MQSTAVRIRTATADDLAFVLGLAARFAEIHPPWVSADEVTSGTRRHLRAALLDGPHDDQAFLVAEDDAGERLGFIWVVTQRDFFTGEPHGHVSEVAVAHDGRGAGRALMAAGEEWARMRRYRYLSLNVRPDNARAKALYDALGFAVDVEHRVKPLRADEVSGPSPG